MSELPVMAGDTPVVADDVPVTVSNVPPAQAPLPPTTTAAEDEVTAGQRRINLIWERTQSIVTVVVVMTNMGVATFLAISGKPTDHPVILSSSLFLILGAYYNRTNHSNIGGVGRKPQQSYQGR